MFSRPVVGIGRDAAVGDGERASVGEQDRLVGADAVRRKLADALVARRDIIDANEPVASLDVVLARQEQASTVGKSAVAEEMPAWLGLEDVGLGAAREIERHREEAWAAREGDGAAACAVDGDVVAARGERDLAQDLAGTREQRERVAAARVATCRDKVRRLGALSRFGACIWAGRQGQSGANEKAASIDQHGSLPP